MGDNGAEKHNWWTTLPGILTGLAALLTAITGLYLAFARAPQPQDSSKSVVAARAPQPPMSTQESSKSVVAARTERASRADKSGIDIERVPKDESSPTSQPLPSLPKPNPSIVITCPNGLQPFPINDFTSYSSGRGSGNGGLWQINVNKPSTGSGVIVLGSGRQITCQAEIGPGFRIVKANGTFDPAQAYTAPSCADPNSGPSRGSQILDAVQESHSISANGQTADIVVTEKGLGTVCGIVNLSISIRYEEN